MGPDRTLLGGALQLSQILEVETKKDPSRFVELLFRIGTDINDAYPAAILRGLTEGDFDPATIDLIGDLASALASSEVNRWLVRFIERRAVADLQDHVLNIVAAIGIGDADPTEDVWRASGSSGTPYYGGDIDTAGMNSARGAAFLAIATLIAASPERITAYRSALLHAAGDPVLAVRACAIRALRAALSPNDTFALSAFASMVS